MAHIAVKPLDDGQAVVLDVTEKSSSQRIVFRIKAVDVGQFASGLLAASAECSGRTGSFSKLRATKLDQKTLVFVNSHEVAVANAVSADGTAVLMFAIGATELNVGIPENSVAALGRALLTISAARTVPQ